MKKQMFWKKFLAVTLAMLLFVCSVPIGAVAAAPEIARIAVDNVLLIQKTHGYLTTDYDPETDSESEEYFAYWYCPALTVFFSDGSSQEIYDGLEWDGEWYNVNFDDDQSAATPWSVGEHTVTAALLGVTTEFTVEIIENPVVRIEPADTAPIWIIEGANGDLYSEYDPETDSMVEYFRYWYSPTVTVFFQDGTSQEITDGWEWNGEWYGIACIDDQSAKTPWGIGTHTATVEFLGATAEYTVEIIENPVARIEVADTAPIQIIVGTHGYTISDYDPETDSMVDYFYYWYNTSALTAYFKDGSSQVIYGGLEWNGSWYGLSFADDQSAATPWGIGKHTVTVELLGATAEFTVEIIKNPVARIELADTAPIQIVEGTNGYMTSDYDPETDSTVEYFHYGYSPTVTAFFQDGTSQEITDGWEWNGEWYGIACIDDQSAATPWGIGMHAVTVEFLGATAEYTVEIIESPIASLSIAPDRALIQGLDNFEAFQEILQFDMTVIYKDGTQVSGDFDEIYMQTGYYPIFSYDIAPYDWDVGAQTVSVSFMGFSTDIDIEIIANPYQSITISGDCTLDITLTKPNGETVSAHCVSFDCYAGSESGLLGLLTTDQGAFSAEFAFENDSENELNTKNLSLKIGDMTSNTLQNCKWVKAQKYKDSWGYCCYMASWCNYLNIQFDGELTKDNIDGIVALAIHFDNDFDGFPWEEVIEDDIGVYAMVSVDEVQRCIEKYFGIANADLTLANGYDAKTDAIKIYALMGEFDMQNSTIVFENGQWVLNCTFDYDTAHPTLNMIVTEDMVIQHIDMPIPEISPADMNDNGTLDLSDYAAMANIAIGKRTPTTYDRLCGDLNADTVVDFFDVSLLNLILSGKYTLQEILALKRSDSTNET